MNIRNSFIVYLMPDAAEFGRAVDWLRALDSYQLADRVFLVRGLGCEELAAGIAVQLTPRGSYLVWPLDLSFHVGGSPSGAQSSVLAWLGRK